MNTNLVEDVQGAELGKYRLLAGIGHGGMAEVFVAIACGPAGFNKLAVVKRLLPQLASDEAYREMFLQEARLAARLNHPNVVQTYEVGEHEGAIFIAMEYLEGQPLHRIINMLKRADKSLRPATWVRVICDVLAGLHYAHGLRDFDGTELRVVHRDVSPQNVFVTYEGQVKVLDFGIAKAERSSAKTQMGVVKGKYGYMAPEQFMDGTIDCRVDVFTTAAVLWELIAGHQLFGRGGDAQIVRRLLQEPIPRLSTVVPDIDPELDDILVRALEREPDARIPTARELRDALESWLTRTSGAPEDIGRVVAEAFADARAKIRQVLTSQLGERASFARSISFLEGADSVGSIRTGLAPHRSGTHSLRVALAHTAAPPSPAITVVAAPAGRRMPALALASAGVALVLVTLYVARLSRSGDAPAVATTAAQAAVVAPVPVPVPAPLVVSGMDATPSAAPSPTEAANAEARPTAPPAMSAKVTPPVARWVPSPSPPSKSAPPSPAAAPSPDKLSAPSAPTLAPSAPTPAEPAAASAPSKTQPAPQEGRRFRTTF